MGKRTSRSNTCGDVLLAAKRPEELAYLCGEGFGLLHCCEMTAARHNGPTTHVRVCACCHRSWGAEHLARKFAIASRHGNLGIVRNRPWPVHAGVVKPE